jgi:hypothetical protein
MVDSFTNLLQKGSLKGKSKNILEVLIRCIYNNQIEGNMGTIFTSKISLRYNKFLMFTSKIASRDFEGLISSNFDGELYDYKGFIKNLFQ